MAISVKISIDGVNNIVDELKKKDANLVKLLSEGMADSADYVRDKAKEKAPFKTGKLKRAISRGELEFYRNRAKIDIGIDTSIKPFSKDGYYARFQEKGTSKMRPNPYLRPALDESKMQVNSIVANKLREGLK